VRIDATCGEERLEILAADLIRIAALPGAAEFMLYAHESDLCKQIIYRVAIGWARFCGQQTAAVQNVAQ